MDRFIVLSGCSGGGKSTLLETLRRRGYAVVEEPGRRIIAEERSLGGNALPWLDMRAFIDRAMAMSRSDFAEATDHPGPVFFDRGLLDAASALRHLTGVLPTVSMNGLYNSRVFLVPPWPEIYVTDAERPHGFSQAVAEYDRLMCDLPAWGYDPVVLPKTDVEERANLVLSAL